MSKIIMILMVTASFMFAALNLQTASKEELMTIKGIGPKKAEQIIEYRKTNKISTVDDLKNIKGFGDGVVGNVKNNVTVSSTKDSNVKDKKEKIETKMKNKKEKIETKMKNKKEEVETNMKDKKEKVQTKKKDLKETKENLLKK